MICHNSSFPYFSVLFSLLLFPCSRLPSPFPPLGSEACSHFAVYYKHMANRFKDLKISSLVIARMDLTDESPPTHMGLVVGNLPIVVILPAGSKIPPWTFYSGLFDFLIFFLAFLCQLGVTL